MSIRVDVATGEAVLHEVDLQLPGRIPLELVRTYRSGTEGSTPFGHGWRFNLEVSLEVGRDAVIYRNTAGESVFSPIAVGVQATHAETDVVLQHHPNEYVVYLSPLVQQVFPKQWASGGRIPIARVEDRDGNAIHFQYSGRKLARLVDTLGRQVHFGYGGDRITSIQVAGDQGALTVRGFRYDMNGDLVSVQDAARREARYVYQSHLMVSATNKLGGTQYAQYGEDRRCIALWRSDSSSVRRLFYDDSRQTTLVQNSEGYQSQYQNVLQSLVLARTNAEGLTQNYYYDERVRLAGYALPDGIIPTFQRHNREEETFTFIEEELRFALLSLDARGLAKTVEDAYGHPFELTYSDAGRLVLVTTPNETVWRFERDAQGELSGVVTPEGRRLRCVVRAGGRERVLSDEQGTVAAERYDALGRLVELEDGAGRVQRRQYDAAGRVVGVALGGYQVRIAYDAEGHVVSVADSEGQKATWQRDAFGRPTYMVASDGRRYQFQYDREGRLARASDDRGRTLQLAYDPQEAVRVEVQPPTPGTNGSGEAEPTYELGARGEIVSALRGERETAVSYTPEGQPARFLQGDAEWACSYDRDGLLATLADADERRVRLTNDVRGRITAVEMPTGTTIRIQYDAASRVAAIEAGGGTRHTVSYDVLDRIRDVRDGFSDEIKLSGDSRDVDRMADEEIADPLRVVLVRGRYGLVLSVVLRDLWFPLVVQSSMLHGGPGDLSALRVRWTIAGKAAVEEHCSRALRRAHRWLDEVQRTSVLFSRDTQLLGHVAHRFPLLGQFFLERMYHDAHYPQSLPYFVSRHQHDVGRTLDAWVTGPPMCGFLKPSIHVPMIEDGDQSLSHRSQRRGLAPEDVLPLFAEQT